jgi:TrmH family RNA methyltransferase
MPDRIASPHNERVRRIRQLAGSPRTRREQGRVVLEGVRLVRDALQSGIVPDYLLYDPDAAAPDAFLPAGGAFAWPLLAATPEVIRAASSTETPQGVVGVFPVSPPPLPALLTHVLVCDAIADPGNLGTILRSAAAAGAECVLLAPGCADAYNPKTLRAGMGAHFRIPALEAPWTRIAHLCKPLHVYLADMTGDVAYDAADFTRPHALIVGSEAHGASAEAERLAAERVYIPMAAGAAESLNAAVAASVLLFEAARQRRGR